jgi:hypothetical protein
MPVVSFADRLEAESARRVVRRTPWIFVIDPSGAVVFEDMALAPARVDSAITDLIRSGRLRVRSQ